MSTSYEILYTSRSGPLPNLERLENDSDEFTLELVPDPPPSWVIHQNEENYVHLVLDKDEETIIGFDRFGGNDPTWAIDLFESMGYGVRSEHDDDFGTHDDVL
jgi:hypothetical protein